MTKTAKVTYNPDKGNVTDTITVNWGSKTLISKDFYIAPHITWGWVCSDLHVGDKSSAVLSVKMIGTTDTVELNEFKIVDNLNNTIREGAVTIQSETTSFSFEYTPVASQVATGVQLTISYELGGYNFIHKTATYPVYTTTGTYQLTAEEGKLSAYDDSTIVLSSEDSTISAGETITFTSTQGLNAEDTLKEN